MSTFPQMIRATGATLECAGDVARECETWAEDPTRLISDGAARAIASWWQSSGSDGRYFAALASGLDVAPTDLFVNLERALDVAESAESTPATREALQELQALDAWARDRARVFAIWHGGANYAPGYLSDDLETFATLEDAEIETDNRYRSSRYAHDFAYVSRAPERAETPNVGTDSETWVYLSDPRDVSDPWPDYIIRYDPETDEFAAEDY